MECLCYYLIEICCYLDSIAIINPFIWKPSG